MADTALDAITYLRDTAISAGTDISDRIYMSIAPQTATYPLVVMEIVSREETPTQDSGSAVDIYRVQVDVMARNTSSESGFSAASTISNALRDAWSRTENYDDYESGINSVQEVNYFSDFLPDLGIFRVVNDYYIRINRALMAQPKRLIATIVQTGTSAPVLTISKNNFTGIATAYVNEGDFRITNTAGQFTAGKTFVTLPFASQSGVLFGSMNYVWNNTGSIGLSSFTDDSQLVPANSIFGNGDVNGTPIIIEVYP